MEPPLPVHPGLAPFVHARCGTWGTPGLGWLRLGATHHLTLYGYCITPGQGLVRVLAWPSASSSFLFSGFS